MGNIREKTAYAKNMERKPTGVKLYNATTVENGIMQAISFANVKPKTYPKMKSVLFVAVRQMENRSAKIAITKQKAT